MFYADNEIGGAVFHEVFQHTDDDEDTWRSFGISKVGLILLKVKRKAAIQ